MSSTTDPDRTTALLAEAAWVHRLARALLRDAGLAADVAQDALVAALTQPLPSPRPRLRAWLRTVVRRLALAARQRRSEQQARERRAARPEAGDDHERVRQRLALHRRLSAAVMALPEPYRTAVTLRFFDDLPPRALAQRLGVNAATARQQVHRGITMLRQRLDASAGRERWTAMVAATVPNTLLWIPVMTTKMLAGAAAVAVLSLGTWIAWRSELAAPPASAAAGNDATAVVVASADGKALPPTDLADGPTDGRRVALDAATSADGEWVVRGSVVEPPDLPLAGAQVRLHLFRGPAATGQPMTEVESACDAAGHFRFPLPRPDGTVTVQLVATAPAHATASLTQRISKTESPPQDLRLSCRQHDATVVGQVVDAAGKPLTTAVMIVADVPHPVDGEGRFRIAIAGATDVRATAPGFASLRRLVRVGADRVAHADFTLLPGFRISGRVTDEEGRALAGASVMTFYTAAEPTTTNADGRFELTNAEAGRTEHAVFARMAGYVEATRRIVTANSPGSCDLVLRRGAEVRGRVVGPDGQPVRFAELFIGFSQFDFSRLDATSDEDGSFVFPVVASGAQMLVTKSSGLAQDARVIQVPAAGGAVQVDVHLQVPQGLSGQVRDRAGEPVAGVSVSVRVVKPEGALARDENGEYLDEGAMTDGNGAFHVDGLPPGLVNLEVYSDQIVRTLERNIATGRKDVVITVDRAAKLAGTVVDAASGRPITEFTIRFVDPVLQPGEKAVRGYSATWVREGEPFRSPVGTWLSRDSEFVAGAVTGIEVLAPGFAPARNLHVVAAAAPDPSHCVVRLGRGAIVRGHVQRRADNAPVAGARVIHFDRERPFLNQEEDFYGRPTTVTAADGAFEIQNVPPGEASLRIEGPDLPRQIDGPFAVGDGEIVDRVISVAAGAEVRGTLRLADGEAIDTAVVQLSGAFPGSPVPAVCAERRFRFERRFPPGDYELNAACRRGEAIYAIARTLRIDGDDPVDLALAPEGSATLLGRLFADGPELPARCVVTVECHAPTGSARLRWRTEIEGDRFEIRGLPAGRCTITARGRDGRTEANADCTLGDSPAKVDMRLRARSR